MLKRIVIILVAVLLVVGAFLGYRAYQVLFGTAVNIQTDSIDFYIHSGWTSEDVLNALEEQVLLSNPEIARAVMDRKNYSGDLVVSGKYTLVKGMSLNDLIDHLRAGNGEEEVSVTFNSVRSLDELSSKVANFIEADTTEIFKLISDPATSRKYGFNQATFISMFLPDSYRMEWDTNADEFLDRMAREYKKFWSEERKEKAKAIGLSQSEVTTLASIVQAEQQVHADERKVIAGLYLNRMRRGMRLQSDPTVVFAVGDFSINRVLTKHLSTESPYNTYLYRGLPPGPINIPYKQSIDAVLNAEKNPYIYMCARADFSGYHAFATNLAEHNRNAREFQRALNKRKIYR
jgi:UPF0755 protein